MTAPVASPEATQMIAAGAHPDTIDVAALVKQMQAMQAKIDEMTAASGLPVDALDAALKDLYAHVTARAAAQPDKDFSELVHEIEGILDVRPIQRENVDLIAVLVDEYVSRHKGAELDYWPELVRKFQKEVFKQ